MQRTIKCILITGGSGFIGRNLHEYLREKHKVFVPTHKELDLLDPDKVRDYVSQNKIKVIIHGANVGGGRDTKGLGAVVETNLRMFFSIAGCEEMVEKIIHLGSGAEYDKSRDLVKVKEEDFGKRIPLDDYGFYKYVCSKYILNSSHSSKPCQKRSASRIDSEQARMIRRFWTSQNDSHKFICLRLFGVYGKYENYLFKFISNTIVKNLLKMPIVIGQNVNFDYLYVDDLVKIVEFFIDNHYNGYNDYNVASGRTVSLLEIAKLINKISDFQSKIIIRNKGLNWQYTADNSRLKEEIPGFAFTTIEEGIKKLFFWYKKHLGELDIITIKKDPYLNLIKVNR